MKLFVIGVVASVAIPLSSFFWEQDKTEPSITNYTVTYAKADPTPTPTPTPTTEAVAAVLPGDPYLMEIAGRVGVSFPVFYGKCRVDEINPEQILGCYIPGSYNITITEYANQYGEEYISCVILHEHRHYQQYKEGLIRLEKGVITNRDWLELDAYNYAGC